MIGIISDTHENTSAIDTAVAILQKEAPQLVVHCGDIISPPVLEHFRGLPMRFVYGNNDGERSGLRAKCAELGFGDIDDFLFLNVSGKRIFAYHGTRPAKLEEAIASQQFDFVLTGHTHACRNEVIGKTRVINPGALFAAPKYTFALLDPGNSEVRFVELPIT
jgi:putative phosphoesterase